MYQTLRLEGNPFIIRFKTVRNKLHLLYLTLGLEGNPFIIRFKTPDMSSR